MYEMQINVYTDKALFQMSKFYMRINFLYILNLLNEKQITFKSQQDDDYVIMSGFEWFCYFYVNTKCWYKGQ